VPSLWRKRPRPELSCRELKEGPVAIYDVSDDPRIQYPDAAKKKGIASILSLPIIVAGRVIGALRIYTSEH